MFWLDEITDNIIKTYPDKKEFIIRDEKTPSGRVHIGSLRGVVIHGLVAQALQEKGYKSRFIYEINDNDPMDGLPVYLNEAEFKPHMGKPLKDVPSPDNQTKSYAHFFGEEFIKVINKIGFQPEIVWGSDLYAAGKYNKWIEIVLENKDKIRHIYKEVSGSVKPEDWYPLQMVCEQCGKVGTTKVIGWDGKNVKYRCEKNLVKWAEGCGYEGSASPFDGRGKLPWKAEWPVKWQIMNVTVEGSGKDHNAAGGSHNIGEVIVEKVFKANLPFNIPYEFFLFGGAKMSSSKGMGASAVEVADIIPPELLRFSMTRTWPNQTIEFNPEGDTIPRLFDNYDSAAHSFFGVTEKIDDLIKTFHFSQIHPENKTPRFLPRFSRIAFMLQIPRLDVLEEVTKLKGEPLNELDKKEVEDRVFYAKQWLAKWAPEAAKFMVQDNLPELAKTLTEDQKNFLSDIADLLEAGDWTGEELHGKIHELRKASPLEAKEAFQAIYIVLLGKDSGPQAGWFLEALEKEFVIDRFKLKK